MKGTMKTISILLALMLVLSSAALAGGSDRLAKIKAEGKLVVATSPDYAPYEFLDNNNQPVGADISLAKHIADKLGVELQVEALSFDAVLAAVAAGKCDIGLAGMVPKEERKETMDFTEVYYNDGNQCIVILKKNAEAYAAEVEALSKLDENKALTDAQKALKVFAGKTVAAQNGTLQQNLVTEQLPGAMMETFNAIPEAIMMVKAGKVQGLALASVVADQYIANHPDLAIYEQRFDYTSLGVAAGVPKGNPELLATLNEIIAEVIESKLYYQFMQEAVELNNSLNK